MCVCVCTLVIHYDRFIYTVIVLGRSLRAFDSSTPGRAGDVLAVRSGDGCEKDFETPAAIRLAATSQRSRLHQSDFPLANA